MKIGFVLKAKLIRLIKMFTYKNNAKCDLNEYVIFLPNNMNIRRIGTVYTPSFVDIGSWLFLINDDHFRQCIFLFVSEKNILI